MPLGKPFMPLVTYDGRIIPTEIVRDINGEIVPDPSWVAHLKDVREGKFETPEGDKP